jgi:hypothetical protein
MPGQRSAPGYETRSARPKGVELRQILSWPQRSCSATAGCQRVLGSHVLRLIFLLGAFLDLERDLAFGRFATEPFLEVQSADHRRFLARGHLESNQAQMHPFKNACSREMSDCMAKAKAVREQSR